MPSVPRHPHRLFAAFSGGTLRTAAVGVALLSGTAPLVGQAAPGPAGTEAPLPRPAGSASTEPQVSPRQVREAQDAFVRGARALERKDLTDAETQFARAARTNPRNRDYVVALAVTREHRLTDLVQRAAAARKLGHTEEANRLLLQARELDPQNAVVRQHFDPDGTLAQPGLSGEEDLSGASARAADAATLAGPVQLTPAAGTQTFHLRGSAQDVLVQVCRAFGLRSSVPEPLNTGAPVRFDLENASWQDAYRAVTTLTHTFGVPLQPGEVLLVRDTPENRAQYQPLVEETLYMPGSTPNDMTEYANLARNVFNLRVVNAVANAGSLVLRGDEDTLSHVNATFADLVDGGADVLLDLTLYEVDKTHINDLGVQLPSTLGVFPIAATAQNLINANQSIIQQAIANNLIKLTGNASTDALTELEFLLASGAATSTQFSNLFGVFGHYGGLPLAGTYLGSTTSVNAALTSSDVRVLDMVQLRVGDKQDGQFRAGTRYPIQTGIYSSSLPSNLASAAAGLSINGTSVSSLLSQYLGSQSVSVPQIQYEDLGLTLKATPQVLRSGEISVKLDMKIEALGSGSINTLPILNNRQLTSTVTIGRGQTAMLASEVTSNEFRAITGLPFLSEIPGFQVTNKNTEKDSTELMITLTPHVVRNKNFRITSRRLLLANGNGAQQQ